MISKKNMLFLIAAVLLTVLGCENPGGAKLGEGIPSENIPDGENPGDENPGEDDTVNPPGSVTIIESSGWLETLMVKWEKLASAASYNVYYKGGTVSDWTKIDTQLIREYTDYYRADILGLKADTNYEVKVLPVDSSGAEITDNPATASNIGLVAHDRSGFAFNGGAVPGAYKADGTVKDNTRILYITDTNKETVTLTVKVDSKGKEESRSGLQNIFVAFEKGYEDRPLIVRLIGKINEKKGLPFTDDEGTLMIKDNGKNTTSYITVEGVGDDASIYGWGIRTSRASNVEIRNIGLLLANTQQKDALEMQESTYMWVHNCDIFYGKKGSDEDQVKGDGALDVKGCNYVTLSYNHYWDTGKSNLLGQNDKESVGYLTYHHNWYDHSDSRHPRVRMHQVHVYNNYYDGVAKYGVGATKGSSLFVESNYFRHTKRPMLISMQGSDIAGGGGTFQSENGGIIKAYNNFMDDYSAGTFKSYSASNTVEFDAYVVNSAGEPVPAEVKTKQGGTSYSNFDTNPAIFYTYTADTPETAKENVIAWSGRYWHGDFSWTFNNATDDILSDDPMPALMSALEAYTTKLVSVQGIGNSGDGSDGGGTGDGGGGGGGTEITGDVVCTFTKDGGNNSSFTIIGNTSNSKGTLTYDGTSYTWCLKMESGTNISFTIDKPMTLKLVFGGTTAAGGKKVKVNGTSVVTGSDGIYTTALAVGAHTITKGDGINLFYIALSE